MPQPDDCRFTKSHEWIAPDGTVGISDHAQKEITDVVFVELPKAGRKVSAGEACTVIESVKAAFDIYAPVSGTITKVNESLSKDPGLVNRSPYGDGWLFHIQAASPSEREGLLAHANYQDFLKTEAH